MKGSGWHNSPSSRFAWLVFQRLLPHWGLSLLRFLGRECFDCVPVPPPSLWRPPSEPPSHTCYLSGFSQHRQTHAVRGIMYAIIKFTGHNYIHIVHMTWHTCSAVVVIRAQNKQVLPNCSGRIRDIIENLHVQQVYCVTKWVYYCKRNTTVLSI